MKKTISIFGMTLLMLFHVHSVAWATENVTYIDVPVSSYWESDLDIAPVETSGIPIQRNTLTSSYISPYVTSVKHQGSYGACWAFSCMAASEASLIKKNLSSFSKADMSELHLAYYLSHSVTDPLGGTEGDYFSVLDTSTNAFLQVGGNQQLATYRLANWYGLAEESVAEYDSVEANTEVVLPDDLAYNQDVFHLENAYWISLQDKDIVKQMIMKYGAGSASYHTSAAYYSTGSENLGGLEEPVAVYCPYDLSNNHGITIIGWDDNYSRTNFGTYKPTSDGAWYCKNSWGSEWSKDGCFWISYEDASLLSEPVYFYDYGLADNYEYNYQYDGGAYTGITINSSYYANRYTAKEAEYLKAVGFYTRNSDYDCVVEIYLDSGIDDPTSGTLVARKECPQVYAGFHTVELDLPVELSKGDTFSVVVHQADSDGNDVPVILDAYYKDATYSNISVAESGQSFVCHKGKVIDVGEEEEANCRIKAYTDKKIFVTELELNKQEIELDVGESTSLEVTLAPDNASDKGVIWSSDDASVASVDDNGNVTAVGAGETYITCKTRDGSEITQQCKVTVLQSIEQILLNYRSYGLMNGGTVQLTATVLPEDAIDKSIQWTSDDESVAVVSDAGVVTGVGYGTATISCISVIDNECSATCTITVEEKMISLSLDRTEVSLVEGQQIQLKATTNPSVEKTKGVYWMSSDSNIAKVNADGMVTAMKPGGPVTVQCIAKDGSGILASCQVKVISQEEADTQNPGGADQNTDSTDQNSNGDTSGNGAIDDFQSESDTDNASDLLKKQYNINKDGTVQFVEGNTTSLVVTIPSKVVINGVSYKVTSIAANAFKDNKRITKVIIGSNVKSIGKNAFRGCGNLTNVTIGKNVKTIGANAFYNCKKLESVSIGKNVTTIDDKAFYQCSKLSKLVIPSKVNRVGKQAFYKCKSLKSITIKTTKLTSKRIGKKAFTGIYSKATIKVPKKKLTAYKKLLRTRGVGSKVRIKRY